jgi:tricorn protease
MNKLVSIAALFLAVSLTGTGEQRHELLLLQTPTLSKTQIAFTYGGHIWIVSRQGGRAERLVTGMDRLSNPVFSPDGSQVAYAGEYDGNIDVYVVPATGGEPRRLTYHPSPDVPVAWTPDGKSVLFRSHRVSPNDSNKLFTIAATGGFPVEVPLAMAEDGCYSPDGTQLAYSPVFQWEPDWKHYHGGQTAPIWIAKLADSSVVKIPRNNSNDRDPMWVGNTIYFLSDRNGPQTLFAYDTATRKVSQLVQNDGLDIDSASAGPGAIVYSQFGKLNLYDLAAHRSTPITVEVAGDMPELRDHYEKVGDQIRNSAISPTGVRAVFEAHGEIFTVPAEKGDVRNITRSPAVEDRDPAWSPDGKSIAYFSDESGEYALHIRDQQGLGDVRKLGLGQPPSFFYSPTWSPDSQKISYSDKRLNLWYIDLKHPEPVKVDADLFDTPLHEFDAVWSPDSRWLAYTKQLPNHLRAVFVYSLESSKATQITDGMSDVLYPNFDKSGKYLYFTASTNMGLSTGWLDMTSEGHAVTRSVYVAVLRKDLPSPLAPESDDEKVGAANDAAKETKPAEPETKADDKSGEKPAEKSAEKKTEPVKTTIDFEDISQRVLALPIPAANYASLAAGKEGVLFLLEAPLVDDADAQGPPTMTLHRFDLKTRKTEKISDGVSSFSLSFNGEKILLAKQKKWYIAGSDKPPAPTVAPLKSDAMEAEVTPLAQWKQEYREVWRIERDFFYDPHFHGLDLASSEKKFAPYLDNVSSREDLTYLMRTMLSYMSVGHMFVRGGVPPQPTHVQVGLLGADYEIANGRYRIQKVYNGENWNPRLHAPLTQPGVNVKSGEYLLAVNGRELRATDNLYSFFTETAGRQTVIRVGTAPDDKGSREVTVVPVPDEAQLRRLDWIEGNRREVDRLSGGKLAYIHLPDTAAGGFTNFNRYYFSQVGKQGAVIDERYNHGGQLADYIVDQLHRPVMSMVATREGETYSEPVESIYGPKVMIINQFAGSGGDALPWYFRKAGVGPLVGERTWGGLVGIGGYPPLMDGGMVTAPRWAIYGLRGQWEVENEGIAPDIEVWQDPKLIREGHDPQLERAVEAAMELLKKNPPESYPVPKYPTYN